MKKIDTLVDDIYALFEKPHHFDPENVKNFGQTLAKVIEWKFSESRGTPHLRMSNLGSKCLKKLWYQVNMPEAAEKMPPSANFKFLFGNILEEMLLFLAKEAGHTVEGEQDEMVIDDVLGHRDAVIDGVLVDVKSASTYGFKKFADGTLAEDDAFGYIDQINAYLTASQDDPLVTEKNNAAFLAVDKTLGKLALLRVPSNGRDYHKFIQEIRHVLGGRNPPPRAYQDVPDGKSGNRKLGVACSYCEFKQTCWPSLRTYVYSTGPRFLTNVSREPQVPYQVKEEKF